MSLAKSTYCFESCAAVIAGVVSGTAGLVSGNGSVGAAGVAGAGAAGVADAGS